MAQSKSSLHSEFRLLLAQAQKERPAREGQYVTVIIRGHSYQEPAWAVFEMETMLGAVNKVRASVGHPEATMDDLWMAEGLAKGHSDYSPKFALYCAELALYGRVQYPAFGSADKDST